MIAWIYFVTWCDSGMAERSVVATERSNIDALGINIKRRSINIMFSSISFPENAEFIFLNCTSVGA